MTRYVDDHCEVLCEDNNKTVRADILNFQEGKTLSVSLNKSLKLVMHWNGKVYEARMSCLTFVSKGPKITETKESSR